MGNSTPIPDFLPPTPSEPKKSSVFSQIPFFWGWILIPWVLLTIVLTLWFSGKVHLNTQSEREMVLITRIESMGKLELVKYHIKDVVEHTMARKWLPDPTALLIVGGEVVGCIDLTKIQKKNIQIYGDSLAIVLPSAEICYAKINHQESKVYSTQFALWDETQLVDEAYREAEKQLLESAKKSDILSQTQNNAKILLGPLFVSLGFKRVHISF